MKMRKLYEHLLRKLQASPPAKSSTPAAGPSSADSVDAGPVPDQEALNEEFILHLEPEPTSSLCQPPASSSSSLLPPASSSSSLLPPASSSPSLLFPASSSSSLLPPASSSPSLLPPASSSSSLLPPASSSPSLLPPASSSSSLLPPASSSPSLLPPASSSSSLLPPASSSPSPLPTFPSISTAYTSDVPNKKRTRKECRKHRTQKIFKYEEIVDRRVVNEKEVKVKWKPCSIWYVVTTLLDRNRHLYC
ncbi:dual specificity phosphatase 3 [Sarotherodon galilaeus]